MKQYLAQGSHYNDYLDEDRAFYCVIFARDYTDAMSKAQARFRNLTFIELREDFNGDDFVWFDEEHFIQYQENDCSLDYGEY